MPKIAEICGIVFSIFREVGCPHHIPHVRVKYGSQKANFDLLSGHQLDGRPFSPSVARKIRKFLNANKVQLLAAWEQCNDLKKPSSPEMIRPRF